MSFVETFNAAPFAAMLQASASANREAVGRILNQNQRSVADFASLISPAAASMLEPLSQLSQSLTTQRFGKVIRFFAPLYLSNECINNCKYCGFSRDNPILRVTLSQAEVKREGDALLKQGFRNVLLVAGEHPKFISNSYLADCVKTLRPDFPGISLEVGPMETDEYVPLVKAGADGLVVYQETYDRAAYAEMHTAGPKRNFDWRLETPERSYQAGFRRLGIGALFGLSDWRFEALAVALHADYLLRHCWKAQLTISLPRLRPNAGSFEPRHSISDRELAQLICAFRIVFPDVGLVLSTREPARLRDGLVRLGITHLSAGSHTEPGGYTGAGKENIHKTDKGRIIPLLQEEKTMREQLNTYSATGQFEIADERSAHEMAAVIQRFGYEPVWKDWDQAILRN